MSQASDTSDASSVATPAGGEMARRIAAYDWSQTPLGPRDRWPQSLKTAVGICLNSSFPMFVWWGSKLVNIYNDAYAPLLGLRHPTALGMPAKEVWHEIWHQIGDEVDAVMQRGVAVNHERVRFIMLRKGYPEEAFYSYSHSPIPNDDGTIGGLFQVCVDETERVRLEGEKERSAQQRQLALDAAQLGWWHFDVRTDTISLDARSAAILRVEGLNQRVDAIRQHIFPDDRTMLGTKTRAAFRPESSEPISAEFRFRIDGDAFAWLEMHSIAAFENDGGTPKLARIVGTISDVTERRKAADQAKVVLESVTDAFFAIDQDWLFTYLNPQAERLLDKTLADLRGLSIWQAYPGLAGSRFEAAYHRVAKNRTAESVTAFYPDHQRWYEVHVYPGGDGGISVYFRDVTARQEAEAHLRSSEARFRQLADAMPQIVWAARPDGVLDYYNSRWFDFTGANNAEATAVHWPDFVHPQELPLVEASWTNAVHNGARHEVEARLRNRDGHFTWMLIRAEPVRDEQGNITRWFGTCTDIEDRRRNEAREQLLAKIDSAVRTMIDPAQITATHARMLGEFLGVNRCAYADVEDDQDTFNLTGDYNNGVASIVGRYRFTEFGTECLRLMRANLPYVVNDIDTYQPPPESIESYHLTKIQSVICVPLHKGGRFNAAMAVHQITPRTWTDDEVDLVLQVAARCWESIERARVERDLRESEARFRMMADSAPVLIWMSGTDKLCTWFNKPWLDFTGREMSQELGNGWTDKVHPEDLNNCLEMYLGAFDRRESFQMDFRLRRHDGEYRWMADHGVPMRSPDGRFLGYLGTCIDITDRKQAEQTRQALLEAERNARNESDRASRMKDEFLATLSHELRTPLNAILGWSQIIGRNRDLSGSMREGIDVIERNARAQAQIIEDLLDMSQIISGKLRLDVQRVDLSAIVQNAVDTARPTADAKGVRLRSVIDPLHGVAVSGDVNRLQQVLWNLLSNAVKFTPRGGRVQVLLERVNSHLEISVTDTGEGIPPEFLPHVFDRFRQADASTTRRHGGLGLGLSIVKQLVELHGGEVRVKSAGTGQGTTFTVALPLTVLHAEPEDRRHPRALSDLTTMPELRLDMAGLCVLVVDDEPDARALVKRLLEERQAKVATAGSVAEAMQLLKAEHFDLLVSDIGMPGEDGYALIRQVRGLTGSGNRNIPAIALTAYARAEDRVRAVAAGFLMHVAKPVEALELLTMAAGAVGRTGQ